MSTTTSTAADPSPLTRAWRGLRAAKRFVFGRQLYVSERLSSGYGQLQLIVFERGGRRFTVLRARQKRMFLDVEVRAKDYASLRTALDRAEALMAEAAPRGKARAKVAAQTETAPEIAGRG